MQHTVPHQQHISHAAISVGCVVITCSDTRTPDSDASGHCIMHMLKEAGHRVIAYHLVKDNPTKIKAKIKSAVTDSKVHAIIINGGTGISRRDSTFEAVNTILEKRLDGFGEVFRYLTYQEIGSRAIMSRASAGVINGRILFSTPGSENAVKLAMEKLILPELVHMVSELTK